MSKIDILNSIRSHRAVFAAPGAAPAAAAPVAMTAAELTAQFKKMLLTAGGEIVESTPDKALRYAASAWDGVLDFTNPAVRAEYPPTCPKGKLDKVEHALFAGRFGVAENGAIWLTDEDTPHRALPFITQHLILLLDSKKIVATMQDAYRQMRLQDVGYGVFISGPSKTADIEQSLVYGAHGAKEMTVILV